MSAFDDINAHNSYLGNDGDSISFWAQMYPGVLIPLLSGMRDPSVSASHEIIFTNWSRDRLYILKDDGSVEDVGVSGLHFQRPTLAANGMIVFQAGYPYVICKVQRGNPYSLAVLTDNGFDPCVSPDGSWVAYSVVSNWTTQLAQINIDGSNNYLLTTPNGVNHRDARYPCISKSGSWGTYIAFQSGKLFDINLQDTASWLNSNIAWAPVYGNAGSYYLGGRTELPVPASIAVSPYMVSNPSWVLQDAGAGPMPFALIYDYVSSTGSSGTRKVITQPGDPYPDELVHANPHGYATTQLLSTGANRVWRF